MEKDKITHTNAEAAAQAGAKWYKAKVVNPDTNETSEKIRPIFIDAKKDGTLEVVASYLYKFFQMSEKCVMLRNGALDSEIRYIYKDGVYRTTNDSDIMGILMSYIEKYRIRLLNPTVISQALQMFDCTCRHEFHDVMNHDEDIINFQNGLLNIKTLDFTNHTPELMSSIQIPCNWTSKPSATPVFDSYIDTLTSGDEGTKKLLLEYMGAIISNVQGWRFKKVLFLQGKGDIIRTPKSRHLEKQVSNSK